MLLMCLFCLLKMMIKDTDEQPDEEIHRAGSGRVLSTGASVHGVHPPGEDGIKDTYCSYYKGFRRSVPGTRDL